MLKDFSLDHELLFKKVISRWDEAIPLGNGLTGCLIWGDGNPMIFSLDRADLWDTRIAPEWLSEKNSYKELVRLARSGDFDEIVNRFDVPYFRPAPTKIPAGRFELDFGKPCENVISKLSLADATAEFDLAFDNGASAKIRSFLHSEDKYGFVSLSGDASMPCLKLIAHNFTPDKSDKIVEQHDEVEIPENENNDATWYRETDRSLTLLDYPPSTFGEDGCLRWIRQKTCEELEFAIIIASKTNEFGSFDLAYIVVSTLDGQNWFENGKKTVLSAIELGYEQSYKSHAQWWAKYWSKSSINLPDKDAEKHWYLSNYFFGSCSREGVPPISLQGIWTAADGCLPPWKSDYHNDLNTQMNYWHYMKANHMEEGKALVDFIWGLKDKAREFAKSFYDSPGLCLPSTMSVDGKPLGGYAMYSLSITNHAWLSLAFDHYWKYSNDMDFLKERAYPYMKGTAECVMHLIETDDDGKLRLQVSSSPEIHDNLVSSWLTPNSNFDLAILIYLFSALADMSAVLENGEENKWREILNLLPEFSVNDRNVLMLSPDESLEESHRHFSHALAIYPLRILDYNTSAKNRKIIDATITNLEVLGTGAWCGFSFTWVAALYAMQGNGEAAAYQLKLFRECFCSPNGFDLNGDFKNRGICLLKDRPFTLETNISYADSLQEMLLQTHNGLIRVFPAIPDDWKEQGTSFKSLSGENGILVSAAIENGQLKCIKLDVEQNGKFKFENAFSSEKIYIECDNCISTIICNPGNIFELELLENKNYILKAYTG